MPLSLLNQSLWIKPIRLFLIFIVIWMEIYVGIIYNKAQTFPITNFGPTNDSISNTMVFILNEAPYDTMIRLAMNFTGQYNSDWTPQHWIFADDPTQTTMVLVPVGEFQMGSSEAEIDHAVELCRQAAIPTNADCQRNWYVNQVSNSDNTQRFDIPFWIDETEVTRANYRTCVGAGGCSTSERENVWSTQPNHPINYVTWEQALTYCEWRGMRLLTEAEWEYAASGVEGWQFPWGDSLIGNEANHCDINCGEANWSTNYNYVSEEHDDGYEVMAPVGSYPQGMSWVGSLDMAGNVMEWTSSIYEDYPYRDNYHNEDNVNIDDMRAIRGGSFDGSVNGMRTAFRFSAVPSFFNNVIGFRCARSLTEHSQ